MNIRNTLYALVTLPFLAQPADAANVIISVQNSANRQTIESVVQKLDAEKIDLPFTVYIQDEYRRVYSGHYERFTQSIYVSPPNLEGTTAHELGHIVDQALQNLGFLSSDYRELYDYRKELKERLKDDKSKKDWKIFLENIEDKGTGHDLNKIRLAYNVAASAGKRLKNCPELRACFTSDYGLSTFFTRFSLDNFGAGCSEDFAETFCLYLIGKVGDEDNFKLIKSKETDKKLQNLKTLLIKLKEKTKK